MTRFVISHRRAGKRPRWEHRRARETLWETLHGAGRCNADLVGENRPGHDEARHVAVFDADHEEVRRKIRHSDLVVEPPMEHFAGRVRPPEVGEADEEELAAGAGEGESLAVTVTDGDGRPLADTDVFVYFGEGEDRRHVVRRTDGRGQAEVGFDGRRPVSKVAAVPRHSRWPMVHEGAAGAVNFACEELPAAEQGVGWWHRRAGFRRHAKTRGRGIRVGVIDTGVGPNANLDHVHDLGAVVDAALDESGGADIRGHGSHVCGIIGARPRSPHEYGGLAPGATLYSIRVFGRTAGAHQGDIALGIWAMAHEKRCHLINLSLGTGGLSEIERDAIQDAVEHGSLCVCAAGNTGGGVEYPAAFDEAVGVTALGEKDWGPPGSLPAYRLPKEKDRFGRDALYLANFSCFGRGVDAAGAGVGIISTVRADDSTPAPYACYGGTSMATPYVTGVLTARLSRDGDYKKRSADEDRAAYARKQLEALCRDIGLAPDYQGRGFARYR